MWAFSGAKTCHTEVSENRPQLPILGQCSHQFIWPRRASDGRYYQVCRICEAEYEYDWESMQRLQGGDMGSTDIASADVEQKDGELETTPATEVVAFGVQPQRSPRLRLLLEPEPAYRVFFRNLADLVLSRTPPPIATTSTPAFFWNDVLVPSSMPWRRFVESLLGHMIVVTALLILVPKWPTSESIQQRSVFDKSYVSYYTPPKSFPALRSHPARAQANRQSVAAHRPTIRVAPEHAGQGQRQAEKPAQKPAMTLPPDLVSSKSGRLKLPASQPPAPMMPLSATGNSHLTAPAGPTWVVAPPSDSGLPTARRSDLLQASAVAPAPEAVGVSSRRGIATSAAHSAVIAPPPSVSGSMRRAGDINIGESAVVKPAPQLPMSEQSTVSAMIKGVLGGLGSSVVPPPPSVQSSGTLPGGRASLLADSGLQVVPPTPSVQGASNLAGGSRAGALSSAGLQVVPPTPSVQGAGNAARNGRASSLSTDLQAVPPAPSVQGAGSGAGNGRSGALSAGLQAVPPAPSVQGTMQGDGSGAGGGRANSLSAGAGLQGMPPSAQGTGSDAGDSAGAGGAAGETGQAESSSATADPHEPATIEIPLRLIGPVLALPGSSYFSNYEVFIAERKLGNGRLQLIKLVYVSLPYQRRLSEYGSSNWTVPKLRVTRDQSCDESLLQMTWPETDPRPDSQNPADAPALSSKDRNGMLPCYRTTADDYRRALSRSR